MEYIKFEPAKVELCERKKNDKFYLFKNEKILVNKDDGYLLPDRKDIADLDLNIEVEDCIAAYRGENCYTGIVREEINHEDFEFIHLREFVENVEDENQFQLASRASMLKDFRNKNKRCGNCGSRVVFPLNREDRVIKCTKCGQAIWPTNSPAIIVAVTKGDRLLLAQNKQFKKGVYSVVAGFLDLGETFEDCVRREVFEETNIKVKNIKYYASQPWAFPNSMMTGFTAEYAGGEIEVDKKEIVHADWFTKEEILHNFKPSRSIGSRLIQWFLEREE